MRLDASRPSGGLYRVTPTGRVEQKEAGITVANGMAWSPDNRTFYFVDTLPGLIHAYDTEPGIGVLGNRRIFASVPEADGRPDGLCVDSEGGVWCAIWDGWRVNRYTPDGKLDQMIDLPVPRATSVCFGGPDLETLFITSGSYTLNPEQLAAEPLAGAVIAIRPGVKGLPESRFGG